MNEATTELEVTEYVENDHVRMVADSHGTIWDTVFSVKEQTGGDGTISDYQGLLIVNHNAHAHRKIEKVLHMLQEAINNRPKPKK